MTAAIARRYDPDGVEVSPLGDRRYRAVLCQSCRTTYTVNHSATCTRCIAEAERKDDHR